jgi:hypothetical protein
VLGPVRLVNSPGGRRTLEYYQVSSKIEEKSTLWRLVYKGHWNITKSHQKLKTQVYAVEINLERTLEYYQVPSKIEEKS